MYSFILGRFTLSSDLLQGTIVMNSGSEAGLTIEGMSEEIEEIFEEMPEEIRIVAVS
jgi:hypothetical protein